MSFSHKVPCKAGSWVPSIWPEPVLWHSGGCCRPMNVQATLMQLDMLPSNVQLVLSTQHHAALPFPIWHSTASPYVSPTRCLCNTQCVLTHTPAWAVSQRLGLIFQPDGLTAGLTHTPAWAVSCQPNGYAGSCKACTVPVSCCLMAKVLLNHNGQCVLAKT